MDEPLSNLDAKLRVQMRADIAALQRELAVTTVVRHPRPGRGDDDGRPRRRDAQGRAAAGRRPAGALRRPGQPVRRRVHRLAADEHGRGVDRRAAATASPSSSATSASPSTREAVTEPAGAARATSTRPSPSASGPRTCSQPGTDATTHPRTSGCARRRCSPRRSGRRSSSTSTCRRRRSAPRRPRSWRRTPAWPSHRSPSRSPARKFVASFSPRSRVRPGDQIEVGVDTDAAVLLRPRHRPGDSRRGALDSLNPVCPSHLARSGEIRRTVPVPEQVGSSATTRSGLRRSLHQTSTISQPSWRSMPSPAGVAVLGGRRGVPLASSGTRRRPCGPGRRGRARRAGRRGSSRTGYSSTRRTPAAASTRRRCAGTSSRQASVDPLAEQHQQRRRAGPAAPAPGLGDAAQLVGVDAEAQRAVERPRRRPDADRWGEQGERGRRSSAPGSRRRPSTCSSIAAAGAVHGDAEPLVRVGALDAEHVDGLVAVEAVEPVQAGGRAVGDRRRPRRQRRRHRPAAGT